MIMNYLVYTCRKTVAPSSTSPLSIVITCIGGTLNAFTRRSIFVHLSMHGKITVAPGPRIFWAFPSRRTTSRSQSETNWRIF